MVKKQKNVLCGNRQSHYIHKTFYIFDDIFKDIAEDVETWFDASNYELNRPLPKRIKTK